MAILSLCEAMLPFIEITTAGSCPVRCSKYCPHEVYRDRYGNEFDMMSPSDFSKILSNVPKNVIINFAGFCEPLVNPYAIDMIEDAHNSGYQVALFTTLHGATRKDVDRLEKIPFVEIALHLPDPYRISRIDEGPDYWDLVGRLVKAQRNLFFAVMNDKFETCNRENVCRGRLPPSKRPSAFYWCDKFTVSQFIVVPNGDVYFCCEDFGLTHRIGNLISQTWEELERKATPPKELCKYCDYFRFYPIWYGKHWYNKKKVSASHMAGRLAASGETADV